MVLVLPSFARSGEIRREAGAAHGSDAAAAGADAAWQELSEWADVQRRKPNEDPVVHLVREEERRLHLRQAGLDFWENYPDDARRWDWLIATLKAAPNYWADGIRGAEMLAAGKQADAAVDNDARNEWQALLKGRLGPQFLASRQPTSTQRAAYLRSKMEIIWADALTHKNRAGTVPAALVSEFSETLALYAAELGADSSGYIPTGTDKLRALMRASDTGADGWREIVRMLGHSPNGTLAGLAAGMQRIIQMHETPLELKVNVAEDRVQDVAAWRGKVVLVYIWSTSCASCVERLPKLQHAYEVYNSRGFEMLTVCIDPERNRSRVREMMKEINASWPAAFEPSETTDLRERLAITSVPVFLLLDESGRLITTDLHEPGTLERELDQRLPRRPISNATPWPWDRKDVRIRDDSDGYGPGLGELVRGSATLGSLALPDIWCAR